MTVIPAAVPVVPAVPVAVLVVVPAAIPAAVPGEIIWLTAVPAAVVAENREVEDYTAVLPGLIEQVVLTATVPITQILGGAVMVEAGWAAALQGDRPAAVALKAVRPKGTNFPGFGSLYKSWRWVA
jgi:hypothetical protein